MDAHNNTPTNEPGQLPTDPIEERIAWAMKTLEQLFIAGREDGHFTPTAVLLNPKDTAILAVPQFGDRQKKRTAGKFVSEKAKISATWAMILAGDVWAVESKNPILHQRPSMSPDKKAMLSIMTIWPDGTCNQKLMPYHMEKGKVIWEKPDPFWTHDEDVKGKQNMIPAWETGSLLAKGQSTN